MIYIIILALIIVALVYVKRNFKTLTVGSMAMVTGGVKCGKSTLSVYLVMREYRKRLRSYKISQFIYKITRLERFNYEKPLLYSNVPLKTKYVPLTRELLLREKRFAYGSVIYVQESSLVADSMMCKDITLSDPLLMFNKLIGHETKGGIIFYDTHQVSDNHFSIKRTISNYFYIQKLVSWIPGFLVAYVKECRYSDDGSVVSADVNDLDDTVKKVLVPKKTWKLFDTYCYSNLTDDLPVESNVIDNTRGLNMKADNIVSFKESRNVQKK